MGYYTKFTITVAPEDFDVLKAAVPPHYSFYEHKGEMVGGDSMKWYEHEAEILAVSKAYPDHTFRLTGIGEQWPDAWVKFFRNGELTKVDLTTVIPESPPVGANWTSKASET